MNTETKSGFKWATPVDGKITVPDELDKLVNSMMFQYGLHKHSRLFGLEEMVCRMAEIAQHFFTTPIADESGEDWQSKVLFYREQTEKLRKYISDNNIGKPNQGFFDAIYDELQKRATTPILGEFIGNIDTVGKCANCGVEFHIHKL